MLMTKWLDCADDEMMTWHHHNRIDRSRFRSSQCQQLGVQTMKLWSTELLNVDDRRSRCSNVRWCPGIPDSTAVCPSSYLYMYMHHTFIRAKMSAARKILAKKQQEAQLPPRQRARCGCRSKQPKSIHPVYNLRLLSSPTHYLVIYLCTMQY